MLQIWCKEALMTCLKCGGDQLKKNGFVSGIQRYKCKGCGYQATRFTPRGYSIKDKSLALALYVSGLSMNRIGLIIGVSCQSVMRWMRGFGEALKPSPEPLSEDEILEFEIDEMHHFLKKKTRNSGFGRYMIVPLSDALPGSWAIVPVSPSLNSWVALIPGWDIPITPITTMLMGMF